MTTTATTVNPPKNCLILSAEEWLTTDFRVEESEILIGTPEHAIVRPLTKNLIQAPEKAYKTTFLLRLTLALSIGDTVFPSLPANGSHRVLYLHGELAPAELKERLQEAARELLRPLDQFFQGRSLSASLVTDQGRGAIRELVEQYRPKVLVIDPWQSFIAGADENSFKEISAATKFLDMLISDHGFHPDHLRPSYITAEPASPATEHSQYGIFCIKGPGIKKDEIIYGTGFEANQDFTKYRIFNVEGTIPVNTAETAI